MQYMITDFFRYEQPLINQLRSEGKFVYGLRDGEKNHFSIEPKVFVNNIGFLITDTELDLGQDEVLSDVDFFALGGAENNTLKTTVKDISAELTKAKADYEAGEAKREEEWKKAIKHQDNTRERDAHYKLWQKMINPQETCNKAGIVNHMIYIQVIETLSDKEQKVKYFVKDSKGDIIIDSTEIIVKYNCRFSTILKEIAKKHSLD